MKYLGFAMLLMLASSLAARAQPVSLHPGVSVAPTLTTEGTPLRLAHDPTTDDLYYLNTAGELYRVAPPYGPGTVVRAITPDDHGLPERVYGLAIGPDGTIYLVGNTRQEAFTVATIRRGRRTEGGRRVWSTVARTEPYPRSANAFDHLFNAIVVSPDGAHLFVNSGSRTDHGEEQTQDGLFPGLREIPLTSAIFRLPADAEDVLLPSDEAALGAAGYRFADGVRNTFDLAFGPDGALFGTENAGDRDDADELNVLQEGRHYGFPWRIGLHDTPQQFDSYDPGEDRLINPASFAAENGFFYNDPAYPTAPEGLVFTDPVRNLGPDANRFRDPATGAIRDADDAAGALATFTPHRSPLGLVFDTARALPQGFTGDGFVLSWTGPDSPLLGPFGAEGEDLLHLDLQRAGDTYEAVVTQIARGFDNPIDAVLLGRDLYVITFGGRQLWKLTFSGDTATEPTPAPEARLDVFPNPASGGAHIVLTPTRTERLRLDVFDVRGRRVAVLHEGVLTAGQARRFTLRRERLPAGLYLLRVQGAHTSQTRPFVLLK